MCTLQTANHREWAPPFLSKVISQTGKRFTRAANVSSSVLIKALVQTAGARKLSCVKLLVIYDSASRH
ncbi:hypothetical protein ALC56_05966 [Trachymyrmex septentrionalis]|uniref:Uncharacterized protein n=1 Tax=Trachymyrmex septentrionalis TaxID=34720 RepID=A0A195FGE8_9HYME|nr:hypothetical protein ALC56_05966 [Trachymyrmex septentrionalis]